MSNVDLFSSFVLGAGCVIIAWYVSSMHRRVHLIHKQAQENARGIALSLETQQAIGEMMIKVIKEFREVTSYQNRVMEEFLETYYRSVDRNGENNHE